MKQFLSFDFGGFFGEALGIAPRLALSDDYGVDYVAVHTGQEKKEAQAGPVAERKDHKTQ